MNFKINQYFWFHQFPSARSFTHWWSRGIAAFAETPAVCCAFAITRQIRLTVDPAGRFGICAEISRVQQINPWVRKTQTVWDNETHWVPQCLLSGNAHRGTLACTERNCVDHVRRVTTSGFCAGCCWCCCWEWRMNDVLWVLSLKRMDSTSYRVFRLGETKKELSTDLSLISSGKTLHGNFWLIQSIRLPQTALSNYSNAWSVLDYKSIVYEWKMISNSEPSQYREGNKLFLQL